MSVNSITEALSWRFVTEIWRRYPNRFNLIEAHPGGGQYNCLVLMTKGRYSGFGIDVNRGGSVHVHRGAFGLDDETISHSNWLDKMMKLESSNFLDQISREIGIDVPQKLPTSTPATITFRYITEFLTHAIGRMERWNCLNGYEDTSGYGSGKREHLFAHFKGITKFNNPSIKDPFYGEDAYHHWFLVKGDDPKLCIGANGLLYKTDGSRHFLAHLYQEKKRIWPLIIATAKELLP